MNITEELEQLEAQHLFRSLKTFEPVNAVTFRFEGREVVSFASNDYLGLAQDPRIKEAVKEGVEKFGLGAGASRLVSGNFNVHNELETRLAHFKNKEAAIVFPSGYMANVGVITSFTDKNDTIYIDKLSHASIIDACRMSEAALRVFPHKNYERLREMLSKSDGRGKRLLVTDSVFSMDGDLADLGELVQIKKNYGAFLMIDEAHATGVFGEFGRGLAEEQDVESEIDFSVGTLSKALGGQGGFVAGGKEFIKLLQNKARSFIYTTGLSPAVCAGLVKAIEIVEEEKELRERLWQNVRFMKDNLKGSPYEILNSESPILPIVVGENEKALDLSRALLDEGFFVPAMRYPTVPKGTARLRLTVSACHQNDDITKVSRFLVKY